MAMSNMLKTPPMTSTLPAQPSTSGLYPSITGEAPIFSYSAAIHMDNLIDQKLQQQSTLKAKEPSGSQGAFGGGDLIGLWDVAEQPENGQYSNSSIPDGGPVQISFQKEQVETLQNPRPQKQQLNKLISENYLRTQILKIPYQELKEIKKIGEGAFGQVYLAEWLSILVAVKRLTNNSEHIVEDFKQQEVHTQRITTINNKNNKRKKEVRTILDNRYNQLSLILNLYPP
eukprot:TRINITY_DN3579_c0_g1_i1.p1 TRINITY_DN3579_c0_g1~~TRINITY_DN3579_c0_g1_i1.p1  ORF type:complete len:229 (-),score=21.89 TRINITY_DN3579_c0_g1_i1:952-1638(-)